MHAYPRLPLNTGRAVGPLFFFVVVSPWVSMNHPPIPLTRSLLRYSIVSSIPANPFPHFTSFYLRFNRFFFINWDLHFNPRPCGLLPPHNPPLSGPPLFFLTWEQPLRRGCVQSPPFQH